MTPAAEHVSWWVVLLPGTVSAAVMGVAMWATMRRRRWRDLKRLARAAAMPPEHVPAEPKTVRDMAAGEEGYVYASEVVTSKKGRRVYVAWSARLQDAPEQPFGSFSPLLLRRLERGFQVTIRPGDEFRTGSLPWGWYAPVIEILQAPQPDEKPDSQRLQGR